MNIYLTLLLTALIVSAATIRHNRIKKRIKIADLIDYSDIKLRARLIEIVKEQQEFKNWVIIHGA